MSETEGLNRRLALRNIKVLKKARYGALFLCLFFAGSLWNIRASSVKYIMMANNKRKNEKRKRKKKTKKEIDNKNRKKPSDMNFQEVYNEKDQS